MEARAVRAAVARQYRVGGLCCSGRIKWGQDPGQELLGMLRRGKERVPIEGNQPGPRAERDPVSVVLCLATCRR